MEKEISLLQEQLQALKNFSDSRAQSVYTSTDHQKWLEKICQENDLLAKRYKDLEQDKNGVIKSMQGQINYLNEQIEFLQRSQVSTEKLNRTTQDFNAKEQYLLRELKAKDIEIEKLLAGRFEKNLQSDIEAEHQRQMFDMDRRMQNLMSVLNEKDQEIIKAQRKVQEVLDQVSLNSTENEKAQSKYYQELYEKLLKEKTQRFQQENFERDLKLKEANANSQLAEQKLGIFKNFKATIQEHAQEDSREVVMWQKKYNSAKEETEGAKREKQEALKMKSEVNLLIEEARRKDIQNYKALEQQHSEEVREYNKIIHSLQDQLNKLVGQISQLNNEIKKKEVEVNSLQETIKQQQQIIGSLQQQQFSIQNKDAQIEGLRTTVQALHAQNSYLYPNIASTLPLNKQLNNNNINNSNVNMNGNVQGSKRESYHSYIDNQGDNKNYYPPQVNQQMALNHNINNNYGSFISNSSQQNQLVNPPNGYIDNLQGNQLLAYSQSVRNQVGETLQQQASPYRPTR